MNTRSIDTTRLQRIARAYSETAVFYAALDLEVFTHIAHGVDTEPALAEAMGASALNTERLLTVLRAMGLVEHRDGRYANAP
ncbi:MAG: hypothetical protein KDC48_19310, partial [Planctomycetes bacterium]|nr:hypothetical protein [Planctomycetota bacterium]